MGKASVSNITVSLCFIVIPKVLAMACLFAAACLFAILPPSTSQFCPLAPYCYIPLPGWFPTAIRRLAPYCYSSARTLLLIVVSWHPLCPVAPLAHLPLSLLRLTPRLQTSLRLRWIMVLHCLLGPLQTPMPCRIHVAPDL